MFRDTIDTYPILGVSKVLLLKNNLVVTQFKTIKTLLLKLDDITSTPKSHSVLGCWCMYFDELFYTFSIKS